MLSQLRPVLVMITIFTVLMGLVFPLGFTALGSVAFPDTAGGSLVKRDGKIVGSSLIGQNFTSDKYFQGRPSALMGADPKDSSKMISTPYDAGESGASNLGPTSKTLMDRVTGDIAKAGAKPVPGDMLTTSASGIDPDISPETALRQVDRVAKSRNMSASDLTALVGAHVQSPALGFIGAPHVNVLELNLALDAAGTAKVAEAK